MSLPPAAGGKWPVRGGSWGRGRGVVNGCRGEGRGQHVEVEGVAGDCGWAWYGSKDLGDGVFAKALGEKDAACVVSRNSGGS